MTMEYLGKVVGNCPSCGLVIGSRERGTRCKRCDTIVSEDTMVNKKTPTPENKLPPKGVVK